MLYIKKLTKYRSKIIDLTVLKSQEHNLHHTTDLDNAFEQYMRTSIKYLEMKEIENNNKYNHTSDDDSLFVNMDNAVGLDKTSDYYCDDDDDDMVNDIHLPPMINNFTLPIMQSFWGKPVNKAPLTQNEKKKILKEK